MLPQELIYHYTNIFAFNEIVKSGKVWASDCRYLNDSLELKNASDLFISKFQGDEKRILKDALYHHETSHSHCVFSLSKSQKVLSQWRAYADDGKGICLGIVRDYIPCILNQTIDGTVVDCVYDNHEKFILSSISQNKEEIEYIIELGRKLPFIGNFWDELANNPTPLHRIFCDLLRIKNPAFREEEEVRFVKSVPMNQVQRRVTNGLIIPYIEHELHGGIREDKSDLQFIIRELWLGPKCDRRNVDAIYTYKMMGWSKDSHLHLYDCGYI